MTTLEYMEKRAQKHRLNFVREWERGAPEEMLQNISEKIRHYEAAVEALRKEGQVMAGIKDRLVELLSGCSLDTDEDVQYVADKLVAADVVPVVHGHWTEKQNTMYDSTRGEDVHWFTYVCSKCGQEAMNNFRFCPFCGTRMDGDTDGS